MRYYVSIKPNFRLFSVTTLAILRFDYSKNWGLSCLSKYCIILIKNSCETFALKCLFLAKDFGHKSVHPNTITHR